MFAIKMINRNGYTISRTFKTITACKDFAKFYPLEVFFCWIYDTKTNEMKYQNEYTNRWKKVNNDTFVPYYTY